MWLTLKRIATLLMVVAVVITLHRQGEAKRALCTFKADLEQREADGVNYLADLDAGKRKPIPGISRNDIVRSLQNQQSTLDSLSSLNCK